MIFYATSLIASVLPLKLVDPRWYLNAADVLMANAPIAITAAPIACALSACDEYRRVRPSARRRRLLVHPKRASPNEGCNRDTGGRRFSGGGADYIGGADHIAGQRHRRREHPDDHGDGGLGAVNDGQRDEQPKQRNRHARERHRRAGTDHRARGRNATHRRERLTATTVVVDRCIGSGGRVERLNGHHHRHHRLRDHRSGPRRGPHAPSSDYAPRQDGGRKELARDGIPFLRTETDAEPP